MEISADVKKIDLLIVSQCVFQDTHFYIGHVARSVKQKRAAHFFSDHFSVSQGQNGVGHSTPMSPRKMAKMRVFDRLESPCLSFCSPL